MPPPQWREASAGRLERAGVTMKAPSVLLIGPYDPHCVGIWIRELGGAQAVAPPLVPRSLSVARGAARAARRALSALIPSIGRPPQVAFAIAAAGRFDSRRNAPDTLSHTRPRSVTG